MKVKLLCSLSGTKENHAYGDEVEMKDSDAVTFIERNLAVPVVEVQREDARANHDQVERRTQLVQISPTSSASPVDRGAVRATITERVDELLAGYNAAAAQENTGPAPQTTAPAHETSGPAPETTAPAHETAGNQGDDTKAE